MQLHQLQPKSYNKDKKRIGRGGKRGTYSGRGVKGQKSRAGHKLQPPMRELFKRYPKLRGYRQILKSKIESAVNLQDLEKNFENGAKISPDALVEKGIVRRIQGRIPAVKILGKGKITKKFVIDGCQFSKTAREVVEKAGWMIK